MLRRRDALLDKLHVPENAIRASLVRQFLTCGKKNCRCRRGEKHGPFYYLTVCLRVGSIRKFLLKTAAQREDARRAIAEHAAFQAQMEELSQLNTELLRRRLPFDDGAS